MSIHLLRSKKMEISRHGITAVDSSSPPVIQIGSYSPSWGSKEYKGNLEQWVGKQSSFYSDYPHPKDHSETIQQELDKKDSIGRHYILSFHNVSIVPESELSIHCSKVYLNGMDITKIGSLFEEVRKLKERLKQLEDLEDQMEHAIGFQAMVKK